MSVDHIASARASGDSAARPSPIAPFLASLAPDAATATVPIAVLLPSDSPRLDGENAEHVRVLAQVDEGLPPIVVLRSTMRVIDGMHRLCAAALRGQDSIEVRFFDGAEHDAFILAVGLNASHGLPLSHRDRIVAATRVVTSHPHLSDRAVARLTGVSGKTVGAIRKRSSGEIPQMHTRVGRDGRARPLSTAHARQLAGELLAERPNASLREIAREAGISPGTVRDVRRRLSRGEHPVSGLSGDAAPVGGRSGSGSTGCPGGARAVLDRLSTVDVGKSLRLLARDPALRFSETGRTMLRLLNVYSMPMTTRAQLVDAIPLHCADAAAEAARGCAGFWLRFAEQIERRSSKAGLA
jgi:hypothetical protein